MGQSCAWLNKDGLKGTSGIDQLSFSDSEEGEEVKVNPKLVKEASTIAIKSK